MDCRTFFEELGRAYAESGLEFPYSYEGFYYGRLPRNKIVPGQFFAQSSHKNLSAKPKDASFFSKALSHPWCYAVSNDKAKAPWYAKSIEEIQKARCFADPSDMVYTLAWELSQSVGRLPEAIHARMVFSADDHPCVRKYISMWGA